MRYYGRSYAGGRRNERREGRCIVEVSEATGFHQHQCSRPDGHGPGWAYCKQHANMIEAGRKVSVPKDE